MDIRKIKDPGFLKDLSIEELNDLANDIVEKVLGYRSEVAGFDDEAVNKILYH